ncbi:MAG: glycosyltransferase, partial [Candidatus Yanofskybacteria bacterium]|nr:glycosyltransferase [Candidatus Yanofskybacteria bacterium]
MTSNRKRILFIITQSEMGGAQRFLYNLLTQINSRYDIRVAVGSDGGPELVEKIKSLNIEVSILEKLKREISPINDIKACFEIKKIIEDFRPNTLFLLSSKAGFLGSLTAKFVIRNPQFRIIYRIGGWTFNDPWPAWKKKLWVNLERLSAPWKDVIIVNNEHDYNQAKELKIKPHRGLALIHNGLDIYKMEFIPREEARLKLFEKISRHSGKIFQTETIIGTIANLYPTKGLTALIETAEYFKNNDTMVFFIIGEGSERPILEKLIKEKGLEKKVYLLGNIPNAKAYLQAFDIFVLPSVKEGFPWALIEAMTARLPV